MSDSIRSSTNGGGNLTNFSNSGPNTQLVEGYKTFVTSKLSDSVSQSGMSAVQFGTPSFNASSASAASPFGGLTSAAPRNVTLTSAEGSVGNLKFEPADSPFGSSGGTLKLNGKTIGSYNGSTGEATINRDDSAAAGILAGKKGSDGKPVVIKGVIMQNADDPGAERGLMDNIGNLIRDPGTLIKDKIIGNKGTSTLLSKD